MTDKPPPARRSVCSSCSKPLSVCLCDRFKHSPLKNSIAVTILQHSHERNHPLNSTRIVKLGMKNVDVITVADIYLQAQFVIQAIQASAGDVPDSERNNGHVMGQEGVIESSDEERNCDNGEILGLSEDKRMDLEDGGDGGEEEKGPRTDMLKWENGLGIDSDAIQNGVDHKEVVDGAKDGIIFTSTITRIGTIQKHTEQPSFGQLLASPVCKSILSNGFIVKKFEREHIDVKYEEVEEYELVIPPGSAVLFPSEKSVSIDAVDFQVKHLIVLDGTWGKAKRMCHENPWLKLLPHLRLEVKKLSLYSEVRHQPKAGCLSTIESIVSALKGLGEDCDGLDDLLGVFESMISDQRRCKEDKMRKNSM